MAHPYFDEGTIYKDEPRLDEADDAELVKRKGEESDDEIDNKLPSPMITVPLTTIPDIITIASNKRTRGKIHQYWGEHEIGQSMIDSSDKDIQDYLATYRQNISDRNATVDITDGTYNDFEHSPLVDGTLS